MRNKFLGGSILVKILKKFGAFEAHSPITLLSQSPPPLHPSFQLSSYATDPHSEPRTIRGHLKYPIEPGKMIDISQGQSRSLPQDRELLIYCKTFLYGFVLLLY